MKAFFGGQIKQDCRGDLAVVITASKHSKEKYSTFIESVLSENFIYLTGIGSVDNPDERVYMGVSHEAAEKVIKKFNDLSSRFRKEEINWDSLDRDIVIPYFLK
jgi:hypothetical protein